VHSVRQGVYGRVGIRIVAEQALGLIGLHQSAGNSEHNAAA
jgi:hypothetical protein